MTGEHCPHCGRPVETPAGVCPHCGVRLNPYALTTNPFDRAASVGSSLRRGRDRHPAARVAVTLAVVVALGLFAWALLQGVWR
ncbi:MAG: hypothetical protein DIU84_02225 [Bacillota bacterium]|nr:MAG: hypothetical protein DIU84_02225 [Bacillota bacterium]